MSRVLLALVLLAIVGVGSAAFAADRPVVDVSMSQIAGEWVVEGQITTAIAPSADGSLVVDGLSSDCEAHGGAVPATGRWSIAESGDRIYVYTDHPCFDVVATGEFCSDAGALEIRFYEPGADRDGFPDPFLELVRRAKG